MSSTTSNSNMNHTNSSHSNNDNDPSVICHVGTVAALRQRYSSASASSTSIHPSFSKSSSSSSNTKMMMIRPTTSTSSSSNSSSSNDLIIVNPVTAYLNSVCPSPKTNAKSPRTAAAASFWESSTSSSSSFTSSMRRTTTGTPTTSTTAATKLVRSNSFCSGSSDRSTSKISSMMISTTMTGTTTEDDVTNPIPTCRSPSRSVSSPRSTRAAMVQHSLNHAAAAAISSSSLSPQRNRRASSSIERRSKTAQELIHSAVVAGTAKAAAAVVAVNHTRHSTGIIIPPPPPSSLQVSSSTSMESSSMQQPNDPSLLPPQHTSINVVVLPSIVTDRPVEDVVVTTAVPPQPLSSSLSSSSPPPLKHHHHHDLSKLNSITTKLRRGRSVSIPKERSTAIVTTSTSIDTTTKEEDLTTVSSVYLNEKVVAASSSSRLLLSSNNDHPNVVVVQPPPRSTNHLDDHPTPNIVSQTTTTVLPNIRNTNQLKHWSRRQKTVASSTKHSESGPTTTIEGDESPSTLHSIISNAVDMPSSAGSTTIASSSVDVADLLASKRAYMLSRVSTRPSIPSRSRSTSGIAVVNDQTNPISSSPSLTHNAHEEASSDMIEATVGISWNAHRNMRLTKRSSRHRGKDGTTKEQQQPDVAPSVSNGVVVDHETDETTTQPVAKLEAKDLLAERRAYLSLKVPVTSHPKKTNTTTTVTRSSSVPSQRPLPPTPLLMERTLLATAVIPPIRGKIRNSKQRLLPPNNNNNIVSNAVNHDAPPPLSKISTTPLKSVVTTSIETTSTTPSNAITNKDKSNTTTAVPSISSTEKRNRAKQLISTRRSTTPSSLQQSSSLTNSNPLANPVTTVQPVVVPSIGMNASRSGSFDFFSPNADIDTSMTTTTADDEKVACQSWAVPVLSIDTSVEVVVCTEGDVPNETETTAGTAGDENVVDVGDNGSASSNAVKETSQLENQNVIAESSNVLEIPPLGVNDVPTISSTVATAEPPSRTRTSSLDIKKERRIAKALRIRSRASTPTTAVADTIPNRTEATNSNSLEDQQSNESTVVETNDNIKNESQVNDTTSKTSASTCDVTVATKEETTSVTSASTDRDDDLLIKTQESTESKGSTTILYDDCGNVVYAGPKKQYASTPSFLSDDVVDKTAAQRANSNDEEDVEVIFNDTKTYLDPMVGDIANSMVSSVAVSDNLKKQDKTEILRASSDEELSYIAEPQSLDFRPILDEHKTENMTAVVEPSWDTSKVMFNEFDDEKPDSKNALDSESWDTGLVTEVQGDKVELVIPAPTELVQSDEMVKEATLDPLGWPVKLDGLDIKSVPIESPCIEDEEATDGDDDSLLPSRERDSNIDESEMMASTSIVPSMSKEERIQQYESMVHDDESSVEDNHEDVLEELDDEEPLPYIMHDEGEEEECDVADLDIRPDDLNHSIPDSSFVVNAAFATFEPSAKCAETDETENSAVEFPVVVPQNDGTISSPQIDFMVEQSLASKSDLTFQLVSESLSLLPPPPPPPGTKKKKSRRSVGKAVPLIAPPPAEKMQKWQDQKTRQIDRLEQMKSKMDNFIALVDSNCNIADKVENPFDGAFDVNLDVFRALEKQDASNGLVDNSLSSAEKPFVELKTDEPDNSGLKGISQVVVETLSAGSNVSSENFNSTFRSGDTNAPDIIATDVVVQEVIAENPRAVVLVSSEAIVALKSNEPVIMVSQGFGQDVVVESSSVETNLSIDVVDLKSNEPVNMVSKDEIVGVESPKAGLAVPGDELKPIEPPCDELKPIEPEYMVGEDVGPGDVVESSFAGVNVSSEIVDSTFYNSVESVAEVKLNAHDNMVGQDCGQEVVLESTSVDNIKFDALPVSHAELKVETDEPFAHSAHTAPISPNNEVDLSPNSDVELFVAAATNCNVGIEITEVNKELELLTSKAEVSNPLDASLVDNIELSPDSEVELFVAHPLSQGNDTSGTNGNVGFAITEADKELGLLASDEEVCIPFETGLADTNEAIFDPTDMSNDPATLRGVFSNVSTPNNNNDILQNTSSADQTVRSDATCSKSKALSVSPCISDNATPGEKHNPKQLTSVVDLESSISKPVTIATTAGPGAGSSMEQISNPMNGKSAFVEAIMVDPTIISAILDFLGDPVAVCRMKMINKSCLKYIDDNEHRLMRDAVRLGGMSMSVRPSFWLWVTLCKGQSPPLPTNSQGDTSNDSDLIEFERQGRDGKWFHVIGRDVSRAFGTLPPHKTGARLRTDSIVRALVTWGRSRMMQSGVKGTRDKTIQPRIDDSTPSDEVSLSPTDTVSDWGGVTPVGSFNGSFASSNSDPPTAGTENGTKSARHRHRKQQMSDEVEFALGSNTLTDAMKVTLQQKLSYILYALAAAHPEVGYCQGMDYLVAHLLRMLQETIRWQAAHGNLPTVIRSAPSVNSDVERELSDIYAEVDRSLVVEETCFRVMNSFFITYSLQHFYWPELRCLKTCCRVFEKIIQLKLPVLADHFEHHELNVGLFALGWFQTLFLYLPSMPSATVCHMWDIWLVERSFKIFFRVGTAILFLSQPILLNHELEGMMGYLNTFPDATLLSPDILIACSLQIKITNRMLMELEQEVQDSAMTC